MAESKEVLNKIETGNQKLETRTVPEMKDVAPRQHVPENIKSWLEKIEEDPGMANPIGDTQNSANLIKTAPTNPKIELPTTRSVFLAGFKKSFDEAGLWLSTFLLKFIKIKEGNVKFKEE